MYDHEWIYMTELLKVYFVVRSLWNLFGSQILNEGETVKNDGAVVRSGTFRLVRVQHAAIAQWARKLDEESHLDWSL